MNDSESITVYTVESLVQLTGVPQSDIALYCENGLIRPAASREGQYLFDDEAIYRLRRIEFLRQEQGVSLAGIQIIFELSNEVHRLREEMRFLRS